MEQKVLLIADDVEMNRSVIKKFLTRDFKILEAENGVIALDILSSCHVDALLLDIIMPEMDGLELLDEISKRPELDHIAVLVATSTKEKTERSALSLGADDVVSKPYDPIVIKKRLSNILELKEMRECKKRGGITDNDVIKEKLAKTEEISQKIKKLADMIQQSCDNPSVVCEIAKTLTQKAEMLDDICGE